MAINILLSCILVFLFVSFGEADRDCRSATSNIKCHKQCCGMDENALHCVNNCNGYKCKYNSDCDEGCCNSLTTLFSGNCGDCPTFPPVQKKPTTERSSRGGNDRWLVYIGLGVVVIVIIVLGYYSMRYYNRRRNRRAVVIVEATRPRTTGVVMIHETETTVNRGPPARGETSPFSLGGCRVVLPC